MAGLKDSANLFASLDRDDPGDSDAAKTTAAPAATSLTQELFGHAYLSARDYLIRQNQLERQAMAEKRAADRAKKAAAASTYGKVQAGGGAKSQFGGAKHQSGGMSGGRRSYNNNNGASRRQQQPVNMAAKNKKVPVEDVEATVKAPAVQPPPSLFDINEFPSLK